MRGSIRKINYTHLVDAKRDGRIVIRKPLDGARRFEDGGLEVLAVKAR